MKSFNIPRNLQLRPSSLDTFVNCPYKWFLTYILGKETKTNVRAIVGTSIHKGIEHAWEVAMATHDKNYDLAEIIEVGITTYDNTLKNPECPIEHEPLFDTGKAHMCIKNGITTYMKSLFPHTPIPLAIEQPLSVSLNHPVISEIKGTLDYRNEDTIIDIKTSKRKIQPQNYALQQSVYEYLAVQNGYTVKNTKIYGLVFSTSMRADCSEDVVRTNIPQVKHIIYVLLKKLDALKQGIDPDVLFSGNPRYFLCSSTYCPYHNVCAFVHGK